MSRTEQFLLRENNMKKNNLKPFNLERALSGEPIVTRDGMKVLQIAHFPLSTHVDEKLSVLLDDASGIHSFYENGRYVGNGEWNDSEYDLFMLPKTKKFWIGISMENPNYNMNYTTNAYNSLEDAKSYVHAHYNYKFVEVEVEI